MLTEGEEILIREHFRKEKLDQNPNIIPERQRARGLTAPTRNWLFSASYDSFVVQQTFVLRMNICGKNRQLLVAANR